MKDAIGLLIAFGVLLVGYAQYRTANQRVVLDLFDRRMSVFEVIGEAIGEITRAGEVTPDILNSFSRARFNATFLFGADVYVYLDELRKDMSWMETYRADLIDSHPNREQILEQRNEVFMRIMEFYKNFEAVFSPYLQLKYKNRPFWRPWD